MTPEYLRLARQRSSERFLHYLQPEDFGYDFSEWISPYTKGAHAGGTVALVLQDWSSADTLSRGVDPDVQRLGRTAGLKTNRYLEALVQRVLGLALADTYVTNAFPYIKAGSISAPIPAEHVTHAVERFTKHELEIAQPTVVVALGTQAFNSLSRCGIDCVGVPHPAARIGGVDAHESIWRDRLKGHPGVAGERTEC